MDDATHERQAAKKLAQIRALDILPEELIALVEQVLPLQRAARASATVALPPAAGLAPEAELRRGVPLLPRERLPFDEAQALGLFARFLVILKQLGGESAAAASLIENALTAGELAPAEILAALPAGDENVLAPWRKRLGKAPRALDFLAVSALSPSLAASAAQLAAMLPPDLPHRGQCPVCGSLPLITFLREKEGLRYACCSFCSHEYRVPRIGCVFCEESDQKNLKLFQVKEYPGVRVDVCETCRMYVKTLDFRELDAEIVPELDDMASVALDMLAQNQGYRRPTLSAWGF